MQPHYELFLTNLTKKAISSVNNVNLLGDRGSTVVKVLWYKSEGRWFDPSWCHWIFYLHKILPIALWPWGSTQLLQEISTRSMSWGQRRPVRKADNLPPSCAVVTKSGNLKFMEISGPLRA